MASPEVELLLDAIIAFEVVVLLYFWYQKRLFPFTPEVAAAFAPLKPGDREKDLMDDIVAYKVTEIDELAAKRDNLEAVVKQAKKKYSKGQIAASTYRGVINDSQKQLKEIEQRLAMIAERD
ncbi:TPA: hypothetical protein HA318_02255 [Candidatus Micrarchaeota archaeon]|nr:MAG: hypothetical protein AUJ65_04220 [Candidatus Micrarchaeota archaeon CG1_02_51_15]HII38801.1 hypothetical protein [Candidatus Micrarchaeota archaeon]